MSFAFEPAKRHNVSLLIGLSGGTGSGKTYSAMRLAKGLAAGSRFAVIDTEAGRANFYADAFDFDRGDLSAPFTPAAYAEAIRAADKLDYPVIVVDSASHEWAGEGGILDMQEAELQRMAGDDWKKREAVKMSSWIRPKSQHKAMLQRLLQVRAHIILCFRAEQKIEMVKVDGKMEVREKRSPTGLDGWIPICEKNMPFELTASFLLLASAPGVPNPIKLPEQLRGFFPAGKPITEAAGAALAEWAKGGPVQRETARAQPETKASPAETKAATPDTIPAMPETADPEFVPADYIKYIKQRVSTSADPKALGEWWNSDEQKQQRARLRAEDAKALRELVMARVDTLKAAKP